MPGFLEFFGSLLRLHRHFESREGPGYEIAEVLLILHRGQTSEAFFVLFSGILFNVKWKHGKGCIKQLLNVTTFSLFSK